MKEPRDGGGAHKNTTAIMMVSEPVMTISLEGDKQIGGMLNLVVPLPWFKSRCMYVQDAKADETSKNLSCNVVSMCKGKET